MLVEDEFAEDGAASPEANGEATESKKPRMKKFKKNESKPGSSHSKAKTEETPEDKNEERRRRTATFPACSFEEALDLAREIQAFSGGVKVRRITLFDHMKKSPESGSSRQLITNSNKYGLTTGSYKAEHLELTPDGVAVVSPETPTE